MRRLSGGICAVIRLELHHPNPNTDLWASELKIGTLFAPAPRKVHTNFGFSTLSGFELGTPTAHTNKSKNEQCDLLRRSHHTGYNLTNLSIAY